MESIINIYCDESCHLPCDGQKAMVLGALWCFKSEAAEHNQAIAELKVKHHLSPFFEIKWSKISPSKVGFYRELVDYFFASPTMGFRAWVIPDKSVLNHQQHNQTHDDWYYKMYFYLLRNLIFTGRKYHIYPDIKDTRSRLKLQKLQLVLRNANYDFSREIIEKIQHVRSHDIALMQLADVLIGAVAYHARGLSNSNAKIEIIEQIKNKTGLSLNRNTLPTEQKFNLCIWRPSSGGFENA
ncbi:DUF3800 domain-containing protein [Desulfobulbus oligotrophicus]|uniref:DUF3800 domain-containing protein n=1 Tax=Desulfobulbus oligotrophicus TaxID=1909699 RepID=A0A7T5VD46_9BACT|nr:DUF3800 domain-containing protein [Desulfobulbus oligotrophicus]QQG65689.1 DUF3800 domain-containing protein [Desulfobulbus oligotrophicus]